MSLFSYLKTQVPIMDVVTRYVRLKPAGTYYKGSCPFHQEATASFTISPDKQIFYCFGCQASGDVISFIARTENIGQWDAAQQLIEEFKVTIPDHIAKDSAGAGKRAEEKKSHFALCALVADWAHQELQDNAHAREYVAQRGISNEMVQHFKIGYIPGGVTALQRLVKRAMAENILVKDLIAAGVLFDTKTSIRSPFEQRIIFPITDALGRNCGFGGRIFVPNDERAKYYNSKESEFFIKGKLLFGFDVAKKAMQERKNVFMVEGYTDCVAMAQHGYENVVATLGTACTSDHLKLLARFAETVYVVFDGDSAGTKAILRLAQLCWQVNLELRVLTLGGTEDPASYLQTHADLSAVIDQSRGIFSFFIDTVARDFQEKTLAKKMEAVEEILSLVARIDDVVKRDILLQEASRAMSLPLEALRTKLAGDASALVQSARHPRVSEDPVPSSPAAAAASKKQTTDQNLEDQLIAACILQAREENGFRVPAAAQKHLSARSVQVLQALEQVPPGDSEAAHLAALQDALPKDLHEWLIQSTMHYGGTVSTTECAQLLARVLQHAWKEVVQKMRTEIQEASARGDNDKVAELLRVFSQLKEGMQHKGMIS
ncbi:MAG: DNA primase [Candidatus Dependentiae bacterium]|jgi:DNA primase